MMPKKVILINGSIRDNPAYVSAVEDLAREQALFVRANNVSTDYMGRRVCSGCERLVEKFREDGFPIADHPDTCIVLKSQSYLEGETHA